MRIEYATDEPERPDWQTSSLEEMRRLVWAGRDPTAERNYWMRAAIERNDLQAVKFLVSAGVPPNAQLEGGLSALAAAAGQEGGDISLPLWLYDKGAEPGRPDDEGGAVRRAERAGRARLARLLRGQPWSRFLRRVTLGRSWFWMGLCWGLAGLMLSAHRNLGPGGWSRSWLWLLTLVGYAVFAKLCATSPGVVAASAHPIQPGLGPNCPHCQLRRPLRSRHCFQCGVCVPRFDHHCSWINGCVGAGNHAVFFVWLSLEMLLLAQIALTNLWLGCWVTGLLAVAVLCYLNKFHSWQCRAIGSGLTLNELVNRRAVGYEHVISLETELRQLQPSPIRRAYAFLAGEQREGADGDSERAGLIENSL